MELKGELYNIGLAFVWRKQQEFNLRETIKIVKAIFNDIGRQYCIQNVREEPINTILRISFGIKDRIHL
jgi:hypothetical protein